MKSSQSSGIAGFSTDATNVVYIDHKSNDYLPLIPEGEYRVAFDYFKTALYFGSSPKLVLCFHVVDMGSFFETPLARWYPVAQVGRKPSRGGLFKIKGQTSIFLIEYLRCLPGIGRPRRLDRIPMSEWPKHTYLARVKNVTRNSKQVELPPELQYSKIESLLGIADE